MALLGARNWYLPAWLDRLLPNVDPHGTVPTGSAGPQLPELAENAEPRRERVPV